MSRYGTVYYGIGESLPPIPIPNYPPVVPTQAEATHVQLLRLQAAYIELSDAYRELRERLATAEQRMAELEALLNGDRRGA